ncbi:MAG: hypothetical protein ACFE8N_15410 [Promethearchaeota archaeon]
MRRYPSNWEEIIKCIETSITSNIPAPDADTAQKRAKSYDVEKAILECLKTLVTDLDDRTAIASTVRSHIFVG